MITFHPLAFFTLHCLSGLQQQAVDILKKCLDAGFRVYRGAPLPLLPPLGEAEGVGLPDSGMLLLEQATLKCQLPTDRLLGCRLWAPARSWWVPRGSRGGGVLDSRSAGSLEC